MKISISISEEDAALLHEEASSGAYASRSGVIHAALRVLRESRLTDAYAQAYAEWAESGEGDVWDATAGDGIGRSA